MSTSQNNLMLLTLNPHNRSVSPITPSPSREMKGIRLFRAISKKLTRRKSREDGPSYGEDDSRSSSTDSYSSTSAGRSARSKTMDNSASSSGESGFRSVSPHHISSSSSEAGSDFASVKGRHHHSTSAESIKKMFQGLVISTRSNSCTSSQEAKKKSKKAAPKSILRPPVRYTYVKGMSGLPTQRVPRPYACGCNMQYITIHR